jgi:hypothetical protein
MRFFQFHFVKQFESYSKLRSFGFDFTFRAQLKMKMEMEKICDFVRHLPHITKLTLRLDGDDHIFFDSLLDAFPALIKLKLYANAMNNLDSRKVKSLLNLSHIKLSTYSGLFHCLQVLNLFRFLIDETFHKKP